MKNKETQLATILISETQLYRGLYNYITKTYYQVKGTKFEFDEIQIESLHQFCDDIIGACKLIKQIEPDNDLAKVDSID